MATTAAGCFSTSDLAPSALRDPSSPFVCSPGGSAWAPGASESRMRWVSELKLLRACGAGAGCPGPPFCCWEAS